MVLRGVEGEHGAANRCRVAVPVPRTGSLWKSLQNLVHHVAVVAACADGTSTPWMWPLSPSRNTLLWRETSSSQRSTAVATFDVVVIAATHRVLAVVVQGGGGLR